jgi:lipoprotein-anchoring transpeptidase ErfK/SrfK
MLTRARMTGAVLAAVGVMATATLAITGAQAAAVAPVGVDPMLNLVDPGQSVVLSDEKKITRWAHASDTGPIRSAASSTARTITHLRLNTEDGYPDVYLVLDGKVDADGTQWLHVRIPGKPNGRTGWVEADLMSQLFTVRTQLTIDRKAKRATLFKNGKRIWQAPIGVGKPSTPTPTGKFWVRELLHGGGGAYGPWAFGTSAYSSIADWHGAPVVGIHGTNEPQLIPGTPSHGCVRMRNNKISQLAKLMPIGTPVRIIH